MIRVKFLMAACLAMAVPVQDGIESGVKSLLNPSTQTTPKSSTSNSDPDQSELSAKNEQETEERIQAQIAEIIAIRKQLGGGVSEQLKGFSIEMPTGDGSKHKPAQNSQQPMTLEDAFIQQLKKETQKSVALAVENTNHQTNEPTGRAHQVDQDPSTMPAIERRETVRHAARMLEEAAAMLEEASEYDQADQVRHAAAELWRTARRR